MGRESYNRQLASNLLLVNKHAGLYMDKSRHPKFRNVILLTAANFGYLDMLHNWECRMSALDLDWAVLALDAHASQALGQDRALYFPTADEHPEASVFASTGFNKVSCSKIGAVRWIMQKTGLDVVFSDPDQLFRHDPFRSSVTLGSMMLSSNQDYVYQREEWPKKPKEEYYHREPREGNTGLYFLRNRPSSFALYEATLQRCEACGELSRPDCDDQTNLWQVIQHIGQPQSSIKDQLVCKDHCNSGKCSGVPPEQVFHFCDLSPWEFPVGSYKDVNNDPHVVGFHANWVVGQKAKIKLLNKMRLWDWSDGTRCRSSAEQNKFHADQVSSQKSCEDADNGATDVDGLGCSQHTAPTNGQWDDSDFTADLMCCISGRPWKEE